mgnify:CR=1 FL=1|tara:strand:+ start:1504 stop:1761 length:258 start_codon:yes stop_codon:yes gene_type:complete
MPPRGRKQTRPIVAPIRRKCFSCGSVKTVIAKHFDMPMSDKPYQSNHENRPNRTEVKGAIVKNYCSWECAGPEFVNTYDDEQFIR